MRASSNHRYSYLNIFLHCFKVPPVTATSRGGCPGASSGAALGGLGGGIAGDGSEIVQ